MADLDDNGILRWQPGDHVMLMCECVEQIDDETVRVKIPRATDGTYELVDVPAYVTLYAGPPLRGPVTFTQLFEDPDA